MKIKSIIFSLILCLICFSRAGDIFADVKIGNQAPDFALTDTYGQRHALSEYRGNFVVLEWVNHGCPFVVKHYGSKNMQKLQKKYGEKGVVWFSVCSSAPGKQGHFNADVWNDITERKEAAPHAVLIDENGIVGRLYGAQTTPHMFIIDPAGDLIYMGAIDSIPSTNPEDIEKADNYVKMALDEAMAGKPVNTKSTKAYGCSVKY